MTSPSINEIHDRLKKSLITALLCEDHKDGAAIRATLNFHGLPTLDIEWVTQRARKGTYTGLGNILKDSLLWFRVPSTLQSDVEMLFFKGPYTRLKLKTPHQSQDPIIVQAFDRDSLSAHDHLASAHGYQTL